jgi:hypothetical protein
VSAVLESKHAPGPSVACTISSHVDHTLAPRLPSSCTVRHAHSRQGEPESKCCALPGACVHSSHRSTYASTVAILHSVREAIGNAIAQLCASSAGAIRKARVRGARRTKVLDPQQPQQITACKQLVHHHYKHTVTYNRPPNHLLLSCRAEEEGGDGLDEQLLEVVPPLPSSLRQAPKEDALLKACRDALRAAGRTAQENSGFLAAAAGALTAAATLAVLLARRRGSNSSGQSGPGEVPRCSIPTPVSIHPCTS